MGTIFVDKLDPQSGTNLTLGSSGDTVTLTSGAKTSGFGKIGQVVTTTFTGTESTTVNLSSANSYTNSSLTASITPTATSSKILVLCTVNAGSSSGSNGCHIGRFTMTISSTTTAEFRGDAASNRKRNSSGRGNESAGSATILTKNFNFVLSPSTTSATTITYQFATRGGGSGTSYINRTHDDGDSTEDGRTASALTLMEILA